ncbi:MAG: hypothetical protein ACR2G6_09115, partial [Gemmatimonadaceae bacterium]
LTAAHSYGWLDELAWRAWAWVNGTIGVVTMYAAIALTLYSLGLYMKLYALPPRKGTAGTREPGTRNS